MVSRIELIFTSEVVSRKGDHYIRSFVANFGKIIHCKGAQLVDVYYIDGKFVPADEAEIPIDDLAILRGLGIFDFMRTYYGKPIFLKEHIARLQQSARQIGLDLTWTEQELTDIVQQVLRRNGHREVSIRIVVTGGSSPDFITPQGNPRLLILVNAMTPVPEWWHTKGVKVITLESERNIPSAKSIDYIPAIVALKAARDQDALEAVYVNRNGMVLEGTTSNLFIFSGNTLITPGKEILSGITRQTVLDLAGDISTVDIRDIPRMDLLKADEVFITGSNRMVVPVIQVDDTVIGDGTPGRCTRQIMKAFANYTAKLAEKF